MSGHTLVVRPDGMGDLLLAGPAIRAVAAGSDRVTVMVGPRGAGVAPLLPGVDDMVVWSPPWIEPGPRPVDQGDVARCVADVAGLRVDRAVVLTSFHQSALPTALLLRMAGVPWVGAMSEDYPGSLLDARIRPTGDVPEAERALVTVRECGFELPPGDDDRLRVDIEPRPRAAGTRVVLHPGTSAPARAWSASSYAGLVPLLVAEGHEVVVTGSPDEREMCAEVAGDLARNDAGATDLAGLAAELAGADVVVCGNTGPAHLAAAVGTPVVSLFAPTVPAARWAPHRVPHVLLGDQHAPCRDTRATTCPVPGHPCLASVTPDDVLRAVEKLIPEKEDPS